MTVSILVWQGDTLFYTTDTAFFSQGNPVNLTTAAAIRDRLIAVIKGFTPNVMSRDRFRPYLNEGGANFISFAEANPAGMFRRFQIRDLGEDPMPEVSNSDRSQRSTRMSFLVAYPQTSRAGKDNALDRDDAMDVDRHQILYYCGIEGGRGNLSTPYPDACPTNQTGGERIAGNGVDFMSIEITYTYQRTAP